MTREDIIKIVNDNRQEYESICRKVSRGNDLYTDLYQEMLLVLLEYDHQKLCDIHASGGLRWFVIRIISNLWKGGIHSSFGQKYRHYQHVTDIEEFRSPKLISSPDDLSGRDMLGHVDAELEKMYWYERELFLAYLRHGDCVEVAKLTGISRRSVSHTVLKVREKLKKELSW